jgi:hypothetical protein
VENPAAGSSGVFLWLNFGYAAFYDASLPLGYVGLHRIVKTVQRVAMPLAEAVLVSLKARVDYFGGGVFLRRDDTGVVGVGAIRCFEV